MSALTDLPVPAPVWRDAAADQLLKPIREPKPSWYFVSIGGVLVFTVRAIYTPRERATRDEPAVPASVEIIEIQLDGNTIGGKDDKGVWHDLTRFFREDMWDRIEEALLLQLERTTPQFQNVFCSNCGQEFGPGNDGFSHCENHRGLKARTA